MAVSRRGVPTPGTTLRQPVRVRVPLIGVGGQFSDFEVFRFTRVSITSAQLKALNGTPVDLSTLDPNLGAPGAGNMICLDFVLAELVYGTATYTAGGAVSITYGSGGPAAHATAIPAALVTAAQSEVFYTPGGHSGQQTQASCVNVGLFINAATANFATGDGTLTLIIGYRILGNNDL